MLAAEVARKVKDLIDHGMPADNCRYPGAMGEDTPWSGLGRQTVRTYDTLHCNTLALTRANSKWPVSAIGNGFVAMNDLNGVG